MSQIVILLIDDMYFIFICHDHGHINMTQISSKSEAKGTVVEDPVYYQATIFEGSDAHAQDRLRLINRG